MAVTIRDTYLGAFLPEVFATPSSSPQQLLYYWLIGNPSDTGGNQVPNMVGNKDAQPANRKSQKYKA